MDTFVDNQFGLNASKVEVSLDVFSESALGQLIANADDAVRVIELHARDAQKPVGVPLRAVVEVSIDPTLADTGSSTGLNLNDVLRNIDEAYDEAA